MRKSIAILLPLHSLSVIIILISVSSVYGKSVISEVESNEVADDTSHTFLTSLVTHIFEVLNLKQVLQDIKLSKTTPGTCNSCKFGIALLQHLLEYGKGREELAALANTICVTLKVESPRVCKGIVTVFKVRYM